MQQRDGQDEDADQNVGHGQIGEEIVGNSAHRRVIEDGGDDERVVEHPDHGDRGVGDGQHGHAVPRLTPRRPRPHPVDVRRRPVAVPALGRRRCVGTVHFRENANTVAAIRPADTITVAVRSDSCCCGCAIAREFETVHFCVT